MTRLLKIKMVLFAGLVATLGALAGAAPAEAGWRHGGWHHGSGWHRQGWRHAGWHHRRWHHGGWRHRGWHHGGRRWRHRGWHHARFIGPPIVVRRPVVHRVVYVEPAYVRRPVLVRRTIVHRAPRYVRVGHPFYGRPRFVERRFHGHRRCFLPERYLCR